MRARCCPPPELLVGSVMDSLMVVAPLSWVTMVGWPLEMKAMPGWLVKPAPGEGSREAKVCNGAAQPG